jgi:hypothetical protein
MVRGRRDIIWKEKKSDYWKVGLCGQKERRTSGLKRAWMLLV